MYHFEPKFHILYYIYLGYLTGYYSFNVSVLYCINRFSNAKLSEPDRDKTTSF